MRKLFYIFFFLAYQGFCLSLAPDYVSLAVAGQKAKILLVTCLVPNLEPSLQAYCSKEYGLYVASLTALAVPLPLQINLDGYVSPFAWSPYDICRFEVGRMINPVCGG